MENTKVKICGIKDRANLLTVAEAGADFAGFVFHPSSPRFLDPKAAGTLIQDSAGRISYVGVFVDPEDSFLEETLEAAPVDMIQLHGTEDPARVSWIRTVFGRPVIKAIGVRTIQDLECLETFQDAADWILFDARHPGSGQTFDWSLLAGLSLHRPWMLSGGLNHGNVADAISMANPPAVDVSSGVEESLGVKSPAKIRDFIFTVKNCT
jgi:phosphoribosylanthranilate isomerase